MPQVYPIGGVSITIPSPSKDLVVVPAAGKVFLDQFVPPDNRLITGFVPVADLQKVASQPGFTPSPVAVVEVPTEAESKDINDADFKQILDSVANSFDTSVAGYARQNTDDFNRRLKSLDLDNARISFDKPVSLGVLFANPNAAGFGTVLKAQSTGIPVSPGHPTTISKIIGVFFLRCRNRVLFAYLYADYVNEDSARWLRAAGERWTSDILKANQ